VRGSHRCQRACLSQADQRASQKPRHLDLKSLGSFLYAADSENTLSCVKLSLTADKECRQFVTMGKMKTHIRRTRERLGLSQAKLAELSKIPQHLLSAFELGKSDLNPLMLESIEEVLSDRKVVEDVTTRRKRYQKHRYEKIERVKERVMRSTVSKGNREYLGVLRELAENHESIKDKSVRAISLFSGCGGFSLGFSAAGFEIVGFLELEQGLRDIYQQNFPNSKELGTDITHVTQESLDSLSCDIGEVDAIIGGPPCQGFSLSGKRQIEDPRNGLFRHYLRFVDAFRPKVAVLENVRLLTSMKSPSGCLVKDELEAEFKSHGYLIENFVINAKDYGVPQHRERVIFVAVREELFKTPSIPLKSHGIEKDLFAKPNPYRTFADACSDLPFLESGEKSNDPLHTAVSHPSHVIEWLWDVKEGASAHENEDVKLRPPSGYNTTYKRQVWDEPASTVQTTFGMISGCRNVHPIATRSLTIREAARIQSFPDSYHFQGSKGTIRKGIGNAVPPLLANIIAKKIREIIS